MSGNEFRFFLSCDINLPVTFSIEKLEGVLPPIKSTNTGTFFFFVYNYISYVPFGYPENFQSIGANWIFIIDLCALNDLFIFMCVIYIYTKEFK